MTSSYLTKEQLARRAQGICVECAGLPLRIFRGKTTMLCEPCAAAKAAAHRALYAARKGDEPRKRAPKAAFYKGAKLRQGTPEEYWPRIWMEACECALLELRQPAEPTLAPFAQYEQRHYTQYITRGLDTL